MQRWGVGVGQGTAMAMGSKAKGDHKMLLEVGDAGGDVGGVG